MSRTFKSIVYFAERDGHAADFLDKPLLLPVEEQPAPQEMKASHIAAVAQAMEERRLELVAQPLARIWHELAKAAIKASREWGERG